VRKVGDPRRIANLPGGDTASWRGRVSGYFAFTRAYSRPEGSEHSSKEGGSREGRRGVLKLQKPLTEAKTAGAGEKIWEETDSGLGDILS